MAGGDAELLGLDFRPSPLPAEALKSLRRGLELGAMAGAGDDRRLAAGKPLLGVLGENVDQLRHPLAGLGRERDRRTAICRELYEIYLVGNA